MAEHRVAGLADAPRPGKPAKYDESTERRILAQLDQPPPDGYTTWTGGLGSTGVGKRSGAPRLAGLAEARDSPTAAAQLVREPPTPSSHRRPLTSWGCTWTPPENAVVISVDEKPAIQALERAQGWLRLPNGQAVRGHNHEYKRHGTTTLFAALEVHTGTVAVGHYRRRRRREFLDFMNRVVAQHPETELHVILDNLSTHKPKHDRWLARHPLVYFHYTPTHASWLNQVEVWFSILTQAVLRGLSATDPHQVRQAIGRFTDARNEHPVPFQWTKTVVHPGGLKKRYAHLR